MAPTGTLVAVHIKHNMHKYCESHSKKGWFVGPALSHHRNVQCCFPHAKSEIMSDIMDLFANAEVIPVENTDEFNIVSSDSLGNKTTFSKGKKVTFAEPPFSYKDDKIVSSNSDVDKGIEIIKQ